MVSRYGAPTRRECFIVVLLLFALLYFSSPTPQIHTTDQHPGSLGSANLTKVFTGQPTPPPRTFETRLSWRSSAVPQTQILAHVPGWTIFDRLYIYRGILYVVSDTPDKVPPISKMFSKGIFIKEGKEEEDKRLPDEKDIRVISTKEARALFGTGAQIIDGVTFYANDPPQFITHYYHWAAELFFGLWRTYSSLDTHINSSGQTSLPPPRRMMFPNLDAFHWRDYAKMNQWVVRSSFPSMTMEFKDDWLDRAEMEVAFVFDRVVVADRSAAMQGYNYQRYQRTAAVAFGLPGSANWWLPIRNHVIQFAGADPTFSPNIDAAAGRVEKAKPETRPVITYISRQTWGRRMLKPSAHDALVKELERIGQLHDYEVNVVVMDKMSRQEQLKLSARTTVMLGVHGNGLTALLWMKPSTRATVMEFFFPEGFAHDYEYTTRAMRMTHYGFWGNEYFTSPALPLPKYVEGFQGNEIPLDGKVVADLVHYRISAGEEVDD